MLVCVSTSFRVEESRVQIADGGLPNLPLDSQPKGVPSFLAPENGIGIHSLPLAQGFPKGPAITVYCGQLSRSSVSSYVCAYTIRTLLYYIKYIHIRT